MRGDRLVDAPADSADARVFGHYAVVVGDLIGPRQDRAHRCVRAIRRRRGAGDRRFAVFGACAPFEEAFGDRTGPVGIHGSLDGGVRGRVFGRDFRNLRHRQLEDIGAIAAEGVDGVVDRVHLQQRRDRAQGFDFLDRFAICGADAAEIAVGARVVEDPFIRVDREQTGVFGQQNVGRVTAGFRVLPDRSVFGVDIQVAVSFINLDAAGDAGGADADRSDLVAVRGVELHHRFGGLVAHPDETFVVDRDAADVAGERNREVLERFARWSEPAELLAFGGDVEVAVAGPAAVVDVRFRGVADISAIERCAIRGIYECVRADGWNTDDPQVFGPDAVELAFRLVPGRRPAVP